MTESIESYAESTDLQAKFHAAIRVILRHEGGFQLTNDPVDRGGRTFGGISERAWPNDELWDMYNQYDDEGRTNRVLYEEMTDRVKVIYYKGYWEPVLSCVLNPETVSWRVLTMMLSEAVVSGCGTMTKMVQESCHCAIDGHSGPKTRQAFDDIATDVFIKNFTYLRIQRFRKIVERDPSQERFIRGWINRASADAELTSK